MIDLLKNKNEKVLIFCFANSRYKKLIKQLKRIGHDHVQIVTDNYAIQQYFIERGIQAKRLNQYVEVDKHQNIMPMGDSIAEKWYQHELAQPLMTKFKETTGISYGKLMHAGLFWIASEFIRCHIVVKNVLNSFSWRARNLQMAR